ncbi:hypothetical protein FSP39_000540 [Pinctada imbricata]|uniref:THAP-type domain-containing protein n=1 Tax=Pinctada imbricata TaxID=66713 RepID=A0AA89C4D4_PINIB|nr:hypothetical protein FSP39_000540 [Pinctada imbricata]
MSTRCCAFNSCTNNATKIAQWQKQICPIHNVNQGLASCICEPSFRLFPFPTTRKDDQLRKKWASIVNRKNGSENWEPKPDSRVCSEHFVDKRPTLQNPYPSLKLGYTPYKPIKSRPPPKHRSNSNVSPLSKKKRLVLEPISEHVSEQSLMFESATCMNDSSVEEVCEQLGTSQNEKLDNSHNDDLETKIASLEEKVKQLELDLSKKEDSRESRCIFSVAQILKSDLKMKFYTGIPTVAAFDAVYQSISPFLSKVRYWIGPRRVVCNPLKPKNKFHKNLRRLSAKEEMILCLMKIRLGLLNEDLAEGFSVSTTHVTNVITTWFKLLSAVLGTLVFNRSKETVRGNLPPSFQKVPYCDVRHIIDSTEVFIEKPNNLTIAAQTWSDYKHHNTAKILVSITPSGMINYISEAWGGRTSDKYVTQHSGFLDIIEPYDKVMADRGFPIQEDLALLHAELLIPPDRRGVSQMSTCDVKKTKQIANRRIYVEQAIRRLKCFRILKYEMPLSLIQHLDDIVRIAAGICNMYPPLPRYP